VVGQSATPVPLNRIDRPGTAEESWDAWGGLKRLPAADPLGWPSVVIVAAHPDDEILGVGGTMSMLAAAGARLRLIAVTDGEASHPGADPEAIARVRTTESAAAREVLGVQDIEVIRLRLPDTGLTACEDGLAARLRELCAGFAVCLAPWEADAHADHEAAGRAARRTGQHVLSYPIWMWHWAKPADRRVPWPRACRIPLTADLAALKADAIQAFASQLTDREGAVGPVLAPGTVAHFTRHQEVLLR
jgi:LmbE family N-acetylglucosaminyl deacetylase